MKKRHQISNNSILGGNACHPAQSPRLVLSSLLAMTPIPSLRLPLFLDSVHLGHSRAQPARLPERAPAELPRTPPAFIMQAAAGHPPTSAPVAIFPPWSHRSREPPPSFPVCPSLLLTSGNRFIDVFSSVDGHRRAGFAVNIDE
jgi:hypothetical protein